MKTQKKVLRIWQQLSKRERRIMRTQSRHGACAVLRCRCKVIVGLVQGKSPTKLSKGGLCSESQVYRVAQRFVEQGSAGMADRREDNGDDKITETYEWELLIAVACSPRDYGYLRTTWTQELLGRVPASRSVPPRSVVCSSDIACDWVGPSRSWAAPGPRPVGCGVYNGFGGRSPICPAARSRCTSTKWTFT